MPYLLLSAHLHRGSLFQEVFPALLNHSLYLCCCGSDHPSLSPSLSWEMASWQIVSLQPGCAQPEDREQVWITYICFIKPCKVLYTSGADLSLLIHAEVASAGQNDILPCDSPGQEGKSWFYLQGGESYIDKGLMNEGKF